MNGGCQNEWWVKKWLVDVKMAGGCQNDWWMSRCGYANSAFPVTSNHSHVATHLATAFGPAGERTYKSSAADTTPDKTEPSSPVRMLTASTISGLRRYSTDQTTWLSVLWFHERGYAKLIFR